MKGLIPFLPIEGVKIDEKIMNEVNKIQLENHPFYIFDKYVMLGEKIENYDDLLKIIMCNIIDVHITDNTVGKKQKGGESKTKKIQNCISRFQAEIINLAIALILIVVAIVNIIRIQNTSIMETTTYKQLLSDEKALVVIDDDKALMLPKIDLGPKVDEIKKKISVREFLQACVGLNKNLITKATIMVQEEVEDQIDKAKRKIRDKEIPKISRDIFNNFMITQGTDIRAGEQDILDINNIQSIIDKKVAELKPTSRIFAAYKFSLSATASDLIDSIDLSIRNFKTRTNAELEIKGSKAFFAAKAHIKNILRDMDTSGYIIYLAFGYLLSAYSYRMWRQRQERMQQQIKDQQDQIQDQQDQIQDQQDQILIQQFTIQDQEDTVTYMKRQVNRYKRMLGIEMSDDGGLGIKPIRHNLTRSQSERLTKDELSREFLMLEDTKKTLGGKKYRKKTRKKRRKTRRKSKKRKSKRRRKKRKKTRRKRR